MEPSDLRQNLQSAFCTTRWTTWRGDDEYVRIRTSCWILEQKGKNFYCDCPIGSKGHMCKHFPGICYKLGLLEVTADVRSKPLGQKRKRGRPQMAKAGHCLVRSPEKSSNVPVAHYHPPSPELALPRWRFWILTIFLSSLPMKRLSDRLRPRELSRTT